MNISHNGSLFTPSFSADSMLKSNESSLKLLLSEADNISDISL